MKTPPCSIVSALERLAQEIPNVPAIRVPRQKKEITFAGLKEESHRLASGLSRLGILRGDRVLLLVPFGMDFITLTFALFKTGAVPVLIDPGLGRKNILQCIEQAQPHAIIAVPQGQAARKVFPKAFKTIRISVTVGHRWLWGGKTLKQVRESGDPDFNPPPTNPDDPAAILFTSGSTGPSKGVLYTHGMFSHQLEVLRSFYGIQTGEIDLPTFPLFGLFGAGMGMTCIIPEMDFTHPADVDPEKIVGPVLEFGVTHSFGSPALWNTVSRYCLKKGIRLPSMRRILMAGAPVAGTLLKRFEEIVEPECKIFTPYGATEALPVTSIGWREILEDTWEKSEEGQGTCVGRPVPGISVKIIKLTDDPILFWDENLELPRGTIGEIVVRGPWVTRRYVNRKDADTLAKIADGDSFLHRMGDVGLMDVTGRIWFCGRKNHRVITAKGTLFTIPCEAIFNRHPDVKRSALVGLGQPPGQAPLIIIEPENNRRTRSQKSRQVFIGELRELGSKYEHTRQIAQFLFHPEFPVDVRHNAKISREKLARWAENRA